MAYKIFFYKKARKEFSRLDKPTKERIKKETKKLATIPKKGKHLRYCKYYSLRIGDYRAIYEIIEEEKKIIVLFIGHRKHAYEDFNKLF